MPNVIGVMQPFPRWILCVALLAPALWATGASANSFGPAAGPGYVPRVPISALAQPLSSFDPSRFHVSSLVSVASGWGGQTHGLQVTSLSYQFRAPLQMSVSVGNAFGSHMNGGSSFFLEGVDLSYRPSANTFFQIRYQDRRSPLQYETSSYFAPAWAR
jgi:hypothetical protein